MQAYLKHGEVQEATGDRAEVTMAAKGRCQLAAASQTTTTPRNVVAATATPNGNGNCYRQLATESQTPKGGMARPLELGHPLATAPAMLEKACCCCSWWFYCCCCCCRCAACDQSCHCPGPERCASPQRLVGKLVAASTSSPSSIDALSFGLNVNMCACQGSSPGDNCGRLGRGHYTTCAM